MMTLILAFASILLSASAQLLMKVGMTIISRQAPENTTGSLLAAVTNPWVVGGLAIYGVSAVLWLLVLGRLPLSAAYPLVSIGIVIVIVGSTILLGETFTFQQAIGAALIVAGIIAIAPAQVR